MTEQQIDYGELVKAFMSQKVAGSTPTATYGHGPGGAFSSFGLSKPVFSSLILPYMGLGGMLPAVPSNDTNPLRGIMTGVTAATGSNATGACDDCKRAGLMKLCTQSVPFGRYCLNTLVYQVDHVGERRNRAEFTDLQLMNQAFGKINPMITPPATGSPLNSSFDKAMFEFAATWGILYASQLFAGSPANNTAGGGYREFAGLDVQVNTGHVDAETGVVCPGADPIVKSMASLQINANGATYVIQMTNVFRNLKFIASRSGLLPARWVIAMRWSAFYELTEIWPCSYLSYRCTTSGTAGTNVNMIDSAVAVQMRDDMRGDFANMTGQYLLIDGEKVQVVIDDGITETQNAGSSFTSSLYFLPITVLGNTPVLYWEYFDFNNPLALADIEQMAPDGSYFMSDGGRFLWHRKPPTNWCVEMMALAKPRIVLETPYIAARMTNINYAPIAHERDYNPSASYYADGGRTSRDYYGPSYYLPVP